MFVSFVSCYKGTKLSDIFHVLFANINLIKVNILIDVFKQNYFVSHTHKQKAISAMIIIIVVSRSISPPV